jgi:DNA-binding transcriptional ArsR family regulator
VRILEEAGLVATEKVGRVRTCRLGRQRLQQELAWIEKYRQLWAARFDALDQLLEDME